MKDFKWIKITFYISAAATALALLWWGAVFHFIGQQTGDSLGSFALCLFAPTADCNMLRGMAWLNGINPYEPFAFLLALTLTFFSGCVLRSIRSQQADNAL